MKKLIISEKPSVAKDLATVLGAFQKFDDRYENDEYVISWAVGHLVELYMPEDIAPELKRWSLKTLPIIPEKFGTKAIDKTKKRFDELKKLLKRDDIDCLINACDAGREGELIFTYIYELAKCKKPFKRLWLSSMTHEGIKTAFSSLRESDEMKYLQDAARCRSEADWLVGINGTRAITVKMFSGSGQVATVGRVQTPTLALIVNRDIEIRNFVPQKYWRITGKFKIHSGEYEGVLHKNSASKDKKNPNDRLDCFWEEDEIKGILTQVEPEKTALVTEKKKRTSQIAPKLYDLTSLQRESNSRFGMPAEMTLKVAQSLYEKHKCLTYPRTDARVLTEDYGPTCYNVLQNVSNEYKKFADKIITDQLIDTGDKRIFNNKQVSDHFAIVPTAQSPKNLNDAELKIYDMVMRRFICVFFPSSEFDITTRISDVAGYFFKTEGKVLAKAGWLAVYGKSLEDESGNKTLPALTAEDGDPAKAEVLETKLLEEFTKPPAHYNEATLLAAMEGAGKFIDDEDLAEAMKERGLGTPATRAQIIEHLINLKYIIRERKDLLATIKADDLMNVIKFLDIETLASPAMTGEWEFKLRQMEGKNFSRDSFMNDISDLTKKIVSKVQAYEEKQDNGQEISIISPTDNLPIISTIRTYHSQDEKFSMNKTICSRHISEEEVAALLKDKKVGPLDNFISKKGREFTAFLVLDKNMKVIFEFENKNSDASEHVLEMSKEDLDKCVVIGKCPLDKDGSHGGIVETDNAYVCKHYFDKKDRCSFRISKNMLERDIPLAQIEKLLTDGKTDLLDNFRSKRTGKFFVARLALKKSGKVAFEFQ